MIQRRFADAPNAAHPALVAVVALVLDAIAGLHVGGLKRRPSGSSSQLSHSDVCDCELIAEPQSFEG
jgi:hypothetical protein